MLAVSGCLSAPSARYEPAELSVASETAPAIALRAGSVDRAVREATVRVRNRTCFGVGTGSGFMVTEDVLVTNRHVVDGADELQVSTWDGRSLDVTVNGSARHDDLAVVQLARDVPNQLPLASSPPSEGDDVVAVGYPRGRRIAFAEGRVVDYADGAAFGQATTVMRVTSELAPGNSGGPVVDAQGRVVGVAFGIERETGLGLVLPVDALVAAARDRGFFTQPSAC